MAEWLGTGLQNPLQQFESAWYLSIPKGVSLFEIPLFLLPT